MKKSKGITSLWLALLLLAGLAKTTTHSAEAQGDPLGQILQGVNAVRAEYGLPGYVWDPTLAAAAQQQANFMAANNIYSHTGAGGSSPQTRALAAGYIGRATENIVGGTNLSPSQGVIWWRNSPVHFNTMISNQYIHAGVGFAQGHDQNFYALVVGVPSNSLPAPSQTPRETGAGQETFAPVAPIALAAASDDGSITHTIGSGQSLWAIAARYEVPLEQILLYNSLKEDSFISPGDTLIIELAEGATPPPTPLPPSTHIVGEGDSAWTIAARFRLSLDEFLALNAMEEDSMLFEGMEVKIRLLPGEELPPTATPQTNHVVNSGDTLWGISVEYGIALNDLLAFNNLSETSVLSIGDLLLVVAPTLVPTETPLPTSTVAPTATLAPTGTPLPTDTPQPQDDLAMSLASAETPPTVANAEKPTGLQQWLGGGTLAVSLGLVLIAGIAIIFIRKGTP